jgi:hypothetical protein
MSTLRGILMYSLFDYYFTPPTRTVYVVSEEQLEKLKVTQKQAEIKEVKVQLTELENAYNRRKSEFQDTLAALEAEVKKLEPVKNGES